MRKQWMLFAVLLLIPLCAAAQSAQPESWRVSGFYAVGYYSGDLFDEPVSSLRTDRLTHVMYAFLKPTMDGSCKPPEKPEQLHAVIEQAHRDGCQVFLAVGGWSDGTEVLAPTFEAIAADDARLATFVASVVEWVRTTGADGVELDWEHPALHSATGYERMVLALSDALKAEGKGFSAALNGAWSATAGPETSSYVSDACLCAFDFISVMGYDMNGEDHSPLWFAETSIAYWLERGVAAEKVVIGMPLYARPSWLQYRDLVAMNPDYAFCDAAPTEPLASYYNGLHTLREKTKLAWRMAGGVMLFDVNEDAPGDYSVTAMIDETLQELYALDGGRAEKMNARRYVSLIVDQTPIRFSAEDGFGFPFLSDRGRALVPVRKALESIGAYVSYNDETQAVYAAKGDIELLIPIGKAYLLRSGVVCPIDETAVRLDGRIYLPVRAVYESFGCTVRWSGISDTVYVETAPEGSEE